MLCEPSCCSFGSDASLGSADSFGSDASIRSDASFGSEDSFGELVQRHVDLVYSAALRQVHGDVNLAQDVAQCVFSDLARKARALQDRDSVAGWLYTSTHFAAAKAVRREQRRRQRRRGRSGSRGVRGHISGFWI